MTEQEKQWFKELHDVKENLVRAHDAAKDPIENWFADESDLYSDTAHFVYELLQNADDSGSTEARFEILDDKLVFAHKGPNTRRFTVSSLDTKVSDVGTDRYGSVNALTDRNGTTKKEDNDRGNAIGKFGRGFKSVYAYTRTPLIYDETIRFKLERFIIPVDLSSECDYKDRKPGETLFVLPFDRKDMEKTQAGNQIKEKLQSLVLPTLFLRNLKTISFLADTVEGRYSKIVLESKTLPNGDVGERIQMSFLLKRSPSDISKKVEQFVKDELWVFSRMADGKYRVSVGFFVDGNDSLVKPKSPMPAFCYFPTRHPTGLDFMIQAPFRLTATRENIKEETSEPHNGKMVEALAELAADSIEYLRDLKDLSGKSLVNDDIIDIIPTKLTTKADYRERLDLSLFAKRMLKKFQTSRIIPVKSGRHALKANAYWPETQDMSEVFSEEQLRHLVGNSSAEWAFATRWADRKRDAEKYDFIDSITNQRCTSNQLISQLDETFMGEQQIDWFFKLHEWIAKDAGNDVGRVYQARKAQIFLNYLNSPISPYDSDNNPQLLMPGSKGCLESRKDKTVLKEFLENGASSRLLECYKAHEPKAVDDVNLFIDSDWDTPSKDDHLAAFGSIFEEYCKLTEGEQREVIGKLKTKAFLAFDSLNNRCRKLCSELYFCSDDMKRYSQGLDIWFFDDQAYKARINPESNDQWIELMKRLGVAKQPRMQSCILKETVFPEDYLSDRKKPWELPSAAYVNAQTWEEPEIDSLARRLVLLLNCENIDEKRQQSKLIWDVLRTVIEACFSEGKTDLKAIQANLFGEGTHKYFNYVDRSENFSNLLLFKLRTNPWLATRDGSFKSPREITIQELEDGYSFGGNCGKILQKLLDLRDDCTTIGLELIKKAHPELEAEIRRIIENRSKVTSDGDDSGNADGDQKQADSGTSGGKNPESEKCLPLDKDVLDHLCAMKNSEDRQEASYPDDHKEVAIYNIKDYLSLNLRIPWYQRPYEWKERNVVELLADICQAWETNKSKYRIGSIILHDNDRDGFCDIVDGQQRTLTLLLILCALSIQCATQGDPDTYGMGLNLLRYNHFYPALTQCKTSRRNLRNNLVCVTEYFRTHPGTEDAVCDAIATQLEVVVVRVKEQSEAFQLFDSQNSKGRPLEPHDLLKAFHLRLIPDDNKDSAKRDVKKKNELVEEWEAHDSAEIGRLFNDMLFRISKWNRKEACYRFTAQDIGAFKGIPVEQSKNSEPSSAMSKDPEPMKFGYALRAAAAKNEFQIGEPILPGRGFFEMVEHYFRLCEKVKNRLKKLTEEDKVVETARRCCGSKYLETLFDSVLLDYFDRFGLAEDSKPELAIRKLCKWAFLVRLDVDCLGPKTPNRYALGAKGMQSKYTNNIPMFAKIKTAMTPAEVTNINLETPSLPDGSEDSYPELRNALKAL